MTKQESRLSIAIESQEAVRNAKAVHKELKSIQDTGDFAAKSVEGTSKSLTTFSQEGVKGASSAKVLAGQIGSVGTKSKTASDGLSKFTQSSNASVASMNMASTAAQALASRIAAIATVGAAVSKMDAFAGFENRLKLVTSSQTELNQAMNDTFRITQSSRQEWDSVVQVYQRFSENAKTLGIDMKKTAELTETVSKAVAISGASSASAEAALTQFGQALASGVLRGEELNSVMEQTPGLSRAIAQGMGITVGQLRAVAAEGKITTDVLVEALTKSKDNVDELFGKTSMTIGQSMTALNNEITKFVGEAGKTSGAAQAIAQSIQLISENLSAISSVAMLGGVAYLTKAILTKGNALRKNASDALAARSAVQVLAVQEQQLAVAVLNDAKAHLASIQATGAATQAKYGATAAAQRYKQALDQVSIAQAKVDSLGGGLAKFGSIASKGLALVGGPIGALTIGITGASAAYGYFSARAEEATQKLAEQAKTADKTDESLKKLTGTEKQKAIDDLTVTFADQEKQLRKQEVAMGSALVAIENYYGVLSKEAKIAQDARNGVISYNEALDELNKLKINKDMYDRLVKEIPKYDEVAGKIQNTATKMKIFGIEVEIGGNKAQNAAPKVDENTKALEGNAIAANAAANAQKSYFDALDLQKSNDQHALSFISTGYDVEVAKEINKLRNEKTKANEKAGIFGIDPFIYEWEIDRIKQAVAARYKLADAENAVTEAKKKQADAVKKQASEEEKRLKTLKVSAEVKENAIKYDFAYYEKLNNLPKGTLTTIHAIETGNSGRNVVNKSSGAAGIFQFMPDTAKQYKLKNPMNQQDSTRAAGEYLGYLFKLFGGNSEKAVRAYHAGEGNVQRGTGMGKYNNDYWDKFQKYQGGIIGYSGAKSDFSKQLNDQNKLLTDQANLRKSLESEVATEVDRILERHKSKLDDVMNANFTEDKKKEVIDRLTEITQNEVDIVKFSLEQKYDDYGDYLRNEEQLLIKSFQQKAFYASHDLSLTKKQREDAVIFLQDQVNKELSYLRLAKDRKLFETRQQFLTETQVMLERYHLEEAELIKVADLKEREFKRQMILLRREEESRMRLQNAQMGWANVGAQMRGTTGRMQVEQDRFSRLDSSQQLFDAQMGAVDGGEQGALGRLQEQRNQDLITEQEFENQKTLILQTALETRQAIYDAHALRQTEVEEAYQKDSINLQLTQAQQLTGSFANMFRGILGESSGAYKTMFAMQQGFAIAQAGMNMYSSASKAYNESLQPTVWGRMADAAKAMLDQGTFLAMIQAMTPQGFATGGQIIGKGTGTSDSIPIMASNGEFMIREFAASKLGLQTLKYINQTGELPYQKFQERLLSEQANPRASVQGFSTGGLVGSHQYSPMIERQRLITVRESNATTNQPKVTIINQTSQPVEATSDWKDGELMVLLTEMRKQNEAMMDAKIERNNRMSKRQGW